MFPFLATRLAAFRHHLASLEQVHIRFPYRVWNSRWVVALLMLVTAGSAHAATPKWERLGEQTGPFLLALARDKHGCVWVGTEDKGVFRYNPSAEQALQWKQFTNRDGLGDNNGYAIVCDKLGRVWVGTRNHGISVYNGDKWKNYGVLDGPLGERIFALAACPTDGDVWMATSAGLARYSLDKDAWSYYTRADGLPSDQANALAFDKEGTLYVGTSCDGIAIARAAGDYRKWTTIKASAKTGRVPLLPSGNGLPSDQINALTVTGDGTVVAATIAGLALSKDQGKTWSYLRGRDYAAKVKGLWGGPPAGWQAAPDAVLNRLLPEDYVTCVAEDDAGVLWLGFRQQGLAAFDRKTQRVAFQVTTKQGLTDDFVTAILPSAPDRPLVGTYGGGAVWTASASRSTRKTSGKSPGDSAEKPPPLPKPAAPPTAEELLELKKRIEALAKDKPVPAFLGEDWTTLGDCVGRYGRQAAMLCAMASPTNHEWSWDGRFVIEGMIGPHCTRDDGLRHWVHWAKTDNPNSLYTPVAGYRRQAEWDDHGEAYARTHDGPDLWVRVEVPAGTYRLSLYFFNKDGHEGMNRIRDYLVQLKPYVKDSRQAEKAPPLASCRVRQFWGGVYKQFVVPGPAKYWVKIGKNDSFNTLCSAVLIDRLRGRKAWYDDEPLPYMNKIPYEPRDDVMELFPRTQRTYTAWETWKALDAAYESSSAAAARQNSLRRLLYRAARDDDAEPKLLRYWRWRLPMWTDEDRKEWQAVMKKAREAEPDPSQDDDK